MNVRNKQTLKKRKKKESKERIKNSNLTVLVSTHTFK